MKKKPLIKNVLVFVLVLSFTIGVILGAVSYCYIPDALLNETEKLVSLNLDYKRNFYNIYFQNMFSEFIWVISVWGMGYFSNTTLFTASLLALRGYFIGFGSAFFTTLGKTYSNVFLSSIISQAIIILPFFTCFSALCAEYGNEVKIKNKNSYVVLGGVYIFLTFVVVLAETFLGALFISF